VRACLKSKDHLDSNNNPGDFPSPFGRGAWGEGEDSLTLSLSQRERESEVVPSMSLTLCIARRRCLPFSDAL
jgi:hypothetical protein